MARKIFTLCSVIIVMLTAFMPLAIADQTRIPDYDTARDEFFWDDLYRNGGETLYCEEFVRRPGRLFNVEHVYPASWMKEAGGCAGQSRRNCRRNSRRFNLMEADLHNLYPALADINRDRNNYPFAILPGSATGRCDFEVRDRQRLVEPTPTARGNIARAVFYMNSEYGASIEPPFSTSVQQEPLLKAWHCADPVDDEERRRNDDIERIQGTRNPFIDNPERIDCSTVGMFTND
ncbi:MAG: endonuclease I family protein [Crocosphaera sp.]